MDCVGLTMSNFGLCQIVVTLSNMLEMMRSTTKTQDNLFLYEKEVTYRVSVGLVYTKYYTNDLIKKLTTKMVRHGTPCRKSVQNSYNASFTRTV